MNFTSPFVLLFSAVFLFRSKFYISKVVYDSSRIASKKMCHTKKHQRQSIKNGFKPLFASSRTFINTPHCTLCFTRAVIPHQDHSIEARGQTGTQFLYGTPSPLSVEIATRTLTAVYFFLRPLPFLLLSHIHTVSLPLQRLIILVHMRRFSNDTPHFHPSTLTSSP